MGIPSPSDRAPHRAANGYVAVEPARAASRRLSVPPPRPALFVGIALALAAGFAVFRGQGGLAVLAAHLLAIACVFVGFGEARAAVDVSEQDEDTLSHPGWRHPGWRRDALPVAGLIVLQLALVRYFGTAFPTHFHQDEFITAYASYQLPAIGQINWYAAYPPPGEWVARFPILFFALQKPFLMALGPTVDAMRISVWPYVALIVVYLYAFARLLSPGRTFAAVAAALAVVFAPSLYIWSLGVHFMSAALFFLAGLFHLIRLLRYGRTVDAALCGLFAGLAYLTYPSSYIALPLFVTILLVESLARRSADPLRLSVPALAVFAVVLLPFVVSALTQYDFLTQRVDQVSALSGTTLPNLPPPGLTGNWDTPVGRVLANLRALYIPGDGGIGGYGFGGLAFFSPIALLLFVLGLVAAVYRGARGVLVPLLSPAADVPTAPAADADSRLGDRMHLYVVGALLAAFLAGMVLTVPPGGLHRISVVYPLIGLTMAVGLYAPLDFVRRVGWTRPRGIRVLRLGLALVLVASLGLELTRAVAMMSDDQTNQSPLIDRYVKATVPPGGLVIVVAPTIYHLGRELFIRSGGQRRVVTEPLSQAIKSRDANLFVVLGPNDNTRWVILAEYPHARFVDTVDGHSLTQNLIVVPGPHH